MGLLQPLVISEWKWEIISIDFITGFPTITRMHGSIMVVVDKVFNGVHFIPIKSTHKTSGIAKKIMKEIFKLYGLPKIIMSHCDGRFTSNFRRGCSNI